MAIKPVILTERKLALFKLQTARGTPATPDKVNDAFLVSAVQVTMEPTKLERKVMRPSFSPIPSGVGRKLVKVAFSHEVKSSGDIGVTRPKLGTLLRACAMKELLVTAGLNQIETAVKDGTVAGPTVTFTNTAAPTQTYGSYKIRVVKGGASATAAVSVTRWADSVDDPTVLPNTRNEAATNDSATTTLVLDATDETSLKFTVGGTAEAGDTLYAVIGGVTFAYTLTGTDTLATAATALAALIDADARLAATAAVDVITVTFVAGAASTVITTGTTAIPLGNSGATITPAWAGSLVVGQEWIVQLYEPGYMYRPVSDQSQMVVGTMWLYEDGKVLKITDCMGTVTFSGQAGQYAEAKFEFTGNYNEPTQDTIPLDATFEQSLPSQVELAQMSIKGDQDFCAQSFTITLANTINPKECMNKADGYDGSIVTGRQPTAQLDPEDTYEIYTAMWRDFAKATQFPAHLRVGTAAGNTVRFYMERANYTGLTYGDRNGLATVQANMQLNGVAPTGDDELRVAFC